MDGFIAKGQKLGNTFKWNSINQIIKYEQGRESKTVSEANDRTRARFSEIFDERNHRTSQSTAAPRGSAEMDAQQDAKRAVHLSTSGSQSHTSGDSKSAEELSKDESVSRDLFFRDPDSVWERGSSTPSLLSAYKVGGGGDDDGKRKKRKRKR